MLLTTRSLVEMQLLFIVNNALRLATLIVKINISYSSDLAK